MPRYFDSARKQHEPFIIELSPPSSPEVSDCEPDDEDCKSDGDSVNELNNEPSVDLSLTSSATDTDEIPTKTSRSLYLTYKDHEPHSPLVTLLQAYRTADRYSQQNVPATVWRKKIIDYLHHNTVTIADVKVLIPAYNHDRGFTKKLISIIGYRCASGKISDPEREGILTHIFTCGDVATNVYERIHESIEHFKNAHNRKNNYQQERQHWETELEQQQQLQMLQKRVQSFPDHMRRPVLNPEFLPVGAASYAQMYAEVYGMYWEEVRMLGSGKLSEDVTHEPKPEQESVPVRKSLADVPPEVNNSSMNVHGPEYTAGCAKRKLTGKKANEGLQYRDTVARKPTVEDGGLFDRPKGELSV